jgi:hypothetical protein
VLAVIYIFLAGFCGQPLIVFSGCLWADFVEDCRAVCAQFEQSSFHTCGNGSEAVFHDLFSHLYC